MEGRDFTHEPTRTIGRPIAVVLMSIQSADFEMCVSCVDISIQIDFFYFLTIILQSCSLVFFLLCQ